MKIHFIISSLRSGGAERVLALLAMHFKKQSCFSVTIITLNKDGDYTLDQSIRKIELHHGKIPNHTVRSFLNLYQFYRDNTNRPDIIISFITLTNMITIPIAKYFNIKIIAAEHNNHIRIMKNREMLTRFTRQTLYKKADLVTVLTSFDVPYYEKYGAQVKVMPNPCSFKPIENNTIKRDKVILAIGNLNRYHHKGFDNLLKFIKPILDNHKDWQLKIVGNGEQGLNHLSQIVRDKNLEDQVIFTGFLKNISQLMQRSSIFILPSRFEGLPVVLLEAMSQGMACIAYNCKTGQSDIIHDENNGLLIKDQDLEDMSRQLNRLMNCEKLRNFLGTNALKTLDRYDIDNITNDYKLLFEDLLK